MIHHSSAVDQSSPPDLAVGIHHGSLHHKASRRQNGAWAHHRRRMDDRRNLIALLQKPVGPIKAGIVVSKGRNSGLILSKSGAVVAAFSDHGAALGRIV